MLLLGKKNFDKKKALTLSKFMWQTSSGIYECNILKKGTKNHQLSNCNWGYRSNCSFWFLVNQPLPAVYLIQCLYEWSLSSSMKEDLLMLLLLKTTRSICGYDAAKDILWKKLYRCWCLWPAMQRWLAITLALSHTAKVTMISSHFFITTASFTSRRYVQKWRGLIM